MAIRYVFEISGSSPNPQQNNFSQAEEALRKHLKGVKQAAIPIRFASHTPSGQNVFLNEWVTIVTRNSLETRLRPD